MTNEQRLKTASNRAVYQRNYRRARDRALAKLANLYPNVYRDLLEQEMIADEKMGKKWLDLDGNTSSTNTRGKQPVSPTRSRRSNTKRRYRK